MAQACKQYGLRDSMVSRWKAQFLERSPELFESPQKRDSDDQQKIADLERMVGKMTMELGILKKASQLLNSL
jgi:transposase-like protein